jgi:phthalate 4,5-dioxygenase
VISKEENDLLTQTGPGTACGELMRHYWQPAALSEELPPGGAPLPVRLLGEDLVLFRDDQGRPGLLGLHCSHRGADLSYGRIEDGGLRCIYHGWLYDVGGRCLEQPGEPAGSTLRQAQGRPFHERIRHTAYPCLEKGGLIFSYLGGGDAPLLPAFEFLNSNPDFRFVTKYLQECNYLQANEGNIDQTHLSYLHRRLSYGRGDSQAYLAADTAPTLEPEITDFGLRLYSIRQNGPETINVKISNFVYPNISVFSGGMRDGYSVHLHVPIDDERHWKYVYHFGRTRPLAEGHITSFRKELTDDRRLSRNQANRYLQDREELKAETFSGMGSFFHAQDACVTEGAGPIQDRTKENLGYTDRAIFTCRKLLLQAIETVQAGDDPPLTVRDASANRFAHLVARADEVPADTDWHEYWKAGDSHGTDANASPAPGPRLGGAGAAAGGR